MIQVLQGNMNTARLVGQLLQQIASEKDLSILLLSEQSYNMNQQSWFSDDTGVCVIWLRVRPKAYLREMTQEKLNKS